MVQDKIIFLQKKNLHWHTFQSLCLDHEMGITYSALILNISLQKQITDNFKGQILKISRFSYRVFKHQVGECICLFLSAYTSHIHVVYAILTQT